jgi:hypothetical protein
MKGLVVQYNSGERAGLGWRMELDEIDAHE